MFGTLDVSTSALAAQRTRLDTIASNIANINTTSADGKTPYRRLYTVFEAQRTPDGGAGVRVSAIKQDNDTPFPEKFEPGIGYVKYPNVNLSTEMVNALETTRAYEANITAIETTKSMINSTLRLIA